ncbi:MAG: hypothetical protein SGPRY_005423 [Prymnesium sp.]
MTTPAHSAASSHSRPAAQSQDTGQPIETSTPEQDRRDPPRRQQANAHTSDQTVRRELSPTQMSFEPPVPARPTFVPAYCSDRFPNANAASSAAAGTSYRATHRRHDEAQHLHATQTRRGGRVRRLALFVRLPILVGLARFLKARQPRVSANTLIAITLAVLAVKTTLLAAPGPRPATAAATATATATATRALPHALGWVERALLLLLSSSDRLWATASRMLQPGNGLLGLLGLALGLGAGMPYWNYPWTAGARAGDVMTCAHHRSDPAMLPAEVLFLVQQCWYCEASDVRANQATHVSAYRPSAAAELRESFKERSAEQMLQLLSSWFPWSGANDLPTSADLLAQIQTLTGNPMNIQQREEIAKLLRLAEQRLQQQLPNGRTPSQPPMAPPREPLADRCSWKPLACYLLGGVAHNALDLWLWANGFVLHTMSSGLRVYVLRATGGKPLIFWHGCRGLLPYFFLLRRLVAARQHDLYLPLFPCYTPYRLLPTIAAQPKHVTPQAIRSALIALLPRGQPAICIAHSMGTAQLAAVMKQERQHEPQLVGRAVFTDPIPFDLISGNTTRQMLYDMPTWTDCIKGGRKLIGRVLRGNFGREDCQHVVHGAICVICSQEPFMRHFFAHTFFPAWEKFSLRPSQLNCPTWVHVGLLDTVAHPERLLKYLREHAREADMLHIDEGEGELHGDLCFAGRLQDSLFEAGSPLLLDAAHVQGALPLPILAYELRPAITASTLQRRLRELLVDRELTCALRRQVKHRCWEILWLLLQRALFLQPAQSVLTPCGLYMAAWREWLSMNMLLRHPPTKWHGVPLRDVVHCLSPRDLKRAKIHYSAVLIGKIFFKVPLASTLSIGMLLLSLAYPIIDDIVDASLLPSPFKEQIVNDLKKLLSGNPAKVPRIPEAFKREACEDEQAQEALVLQLVRRLRLLYALVRAYRARYHACREAIAAALKLLDSNSQAAPAYSQTSQGRINEATKVSVAKSTDNEKLIVETLLADYYLEKQQKWYVAEEARKLFEATGPLGQMLNDIMTPAADMREGNVTPAALFHSLGRVPEFVLQTLEYGLALKREAAQLPAQVDGTAIAVCIHLMMHLVVAVAMEHAPSGIRHADIHQLSLMAQTCRGIGAPRVAALLSSYCHELFTAQLSMFVQSCD